MTSGIIEILREDTGVQALAGLNQSGSKFKIYPVVAPQGEKPPYITVFMGQNDALPSLTKKEVSELDYPRVTVNSWSKNFRPSELMGEAVRNALDNVSSVTDAGYTFTRIWLIDDRDGHDPERDLYVHVSTFGVEVKRVGGAIYQILSSNNFVKWGGIWNWADHSNALPSGAIQDGTMWITEGDVVLGTTLIPDDTLMTAKVGNPSSITDFSFNL